MPSFSLTSSPTLGTSSAGSVRGTIISYARSILPSLPAAWYSFIPFVLAGLMALLFTALLVLLVEDSEDMYPHSPRNFQLNLQKEERSKRLVGLAEQDADESNDADEWAWDPRADTSRPTNLKDSQDWMRLQNEKMQDSSYGYRYRTTNRRLLASPPPSASPQSPAFTPPILSMAKLIMHRHDQSSKRARASSSRPSPPPSPPASASGGSSFAPMQYTLKSAAIKDAKVSTVAFPSGSEEDSLHSPPASPTSPLLPSGPTTLSLPSPPPTPTSPPPELASAPTRHARSRSIASLSLPGLPTLVPALQLLKPPSPTSSSERTLRRKRSSMLEEGGVPASSLLDQEQAYRPQQSAAPTPSPSREPSPESPSSETAGQQRKAGRSKERRSRKRSGSGSKKVAAQAHQRATNAQPPVPALPSLVPLGRRGSEGIAAMEEGARR